MLRRLKSRWGVAGGLLVVALSTACVQLSSIVAPQLPGFGVGDTAAGGASARSMATTVVGPATEATAVLATTPSSTRQLVAVRRGIIAEVLPLNARVSALDETAITYPGIGRVEAVAVNPGDVVEEGQLLLQVETREIERELSAARARVELGTLRMEQAQAQAQARQRQTEQQIEVERARRQSQIVDAEAGLRRAQEDLARVKVGAPAADRRMAEAGVVSARSGVERAEAELVRASAGPSEIELKTADQQVWSARLALHRAQADFDRLKAGPDQAELRAAEREVSNAQSAVDRARLDLERLARGDPSAITAAERDVQRAAIALRTAESTRIDSRAPKDAQRSAKAARDAAIASARLGMQDAQDRLNAARRGPPPGEIEVARRNIQTAESVFRTALDRLAVVRQGPDELTLSMTNQAVEMAKTAAKGAEARYLEIEAGPPAHQVAAAQDAVRSARASLAGALERLAELNSRPTGSELRDVEDRVVAASQVLERARSEPEAMLEETDPGAFDLVVLEKNVEQDRAQVETLERSLAAATLVAPFQGVVSSVQVRPGDSIDRSVQVLTLARPGDPIVSADVNSEDVARVTVGKLAVIQPDGATNSPLDATVIGLLDGPGGIGRIAQLRVNWPTAPPAFGNAVLAVVTVQEKANVLLVPQRAVKSSGQRRYVEYLDGEIRRTIDVSTGVAGAVDVEILSGLREGQLIVAGAAASGSTATTASPAPAAIP